METIYTQTAGKGGVEDISLNNKADISGLTVQREPLSMVIQFLNLSVWIADWINSY